MYDASPAWSRLLGATTQSTSLTGLAEAVVGHLQAMGASEVGFWSRADRGRWRPLASVGPPQDRPPDDLRWTMLSTRAGRRTTRVGWTGVGLDEESTRLVTAAVDGAVRRLEAEAAAEVATLTGDRRLATLLDASPDAVIVTARDGTIVQANARAADLFGYSLDELLDRPIEVLVPDDTRSHHVALRAGYADSPAQRAMAAGRDLRARQRDGTEFPVDIALAPVETDDGVAFAAFVRDATARHESEEHRRRLRETELARDQALELNDNVVQGLTSTVWALDLGETEDALRSARTTLASARRMMSDLLAGHATAMHPGGFQRAQPVPTSGLHAPTDHDAPTEHRGQPDQPDQADDRAIRVVLADDSDDIRLLFEVQLRTVPDVALVATAADGVDVLAAVEEHRPDVVLMDLSMPRLDGLEATERIRRSHPGIRVAVLTGHPHATVAAQVAAAGAHACIEKGGPFADLIAHVRAIART